MKFYTNVRSYGDKLLYVGYENGNRVVDSIAFQPILYVPSPDNDKTEFVSYDGEALKEMPFSSMRDAKEFINSYKGIPGFKMFGQDKFAFEYITRNFRGEIDYKFSHLRLFYIDIEVFSGEGFPEPDEARFPITVIAIHDSKTNKKYLWGEANGPGGKFVNTSVDVVYREFDNEIDLLYDFIQWWGNNCPDIVTGWNSRQFDIPYIINRIKNLLGDKIANKLSPFGMVKSKMVNIKRFSTYTEVLTYDIFGIAELDYLDLYKKYTTSNRESYKLGYIGQFELNETKVDFDGSLHKLYTTDYQKYVEYNIQDVALLVKLEAAKRFLELIVEVSYAGKVATYNDALGTVKYWEVLIYNHLYDKGIQAPIKQETVEKTEKYAGAFVKEITPNIYRWVVSYDIASLYPSAIRQVNIGPETFIEMDQVPNELKVLLSQVTPEKLINKELDLSLLKKYDVSLSGNAKLYRKDKQSFFSEIMEKIFNKRIIYKKAMTVAKKEYEKSHDLSQKELKDAYHIKQYAMKILANSGYGGIGNNYFQYFSLANAEAVTITGQVIIQWIEKRLNNYLNNLLKTPGKDRVIAIDTDSNYIDMSDLVDTVFGKNQSDKAKIVEFLNKASTEKIEPYIQQCFDELFDYMNGYSNNISMVRDVISDTAVWKKQKNYFMTVWDQEGVRYTTPELKMMGVEAVKSSYPMVCRKKLEEAYKLIIDDDQEGLHKLVKQFKVDFYKLPPETMALPKTINEISKFVDNNGNFTQKTTPQHVRASANYNKLVKQRGLEKELEEITDGFKIKYIYLKLPNKLHDDVIAFIDKLPKEFDMNQYIDYNKQFEKAFLSPLQLITEIIGWTTEKQATLGDMFG